MAAPQRQIEKQFVRLPYYESIQVGTRTGATATGLLAHYRYIHYSSPQNELIELYGFAANFQDADVKFQIAEQRGDLWVPFYMTQMTAIFGDFAQNQPVLLLSRPYIIQPRNKLQFTILNNDASNIANTIITLVGSKLREMI